MKKKATGWFIALCAVFGFAGILSATQSTTPAIEFNAASATTQKTQDVAGDPATSVPENATSPTPTIENQVPSSGLSNNNTYTNVDGNTVHSPAYSTDGSVPAGATAQCRDGTYSFSQHHSGTCSGHHGVERWL